MTIGEPRRLWTMTFGVAMMVCTSMPASARNVPPAPPMPSTVATIRCFAGNAVSARNVFNACDRAVDEEGDPVDNFRNIVTANLGEPYDIKIDVETSRSTVGEDDRGPDEAGGAGYTNFFVGFQLLQDLPEDFDYQKLGFIPLRVRSSTQFSYSTFDVPGLPPQREFGVNDAYSPQEFRRYVSNRLDYDGSEGVLLTDHMVTNGRLVETWNQIYDISEEAPRIGGSVILGFTDVRFNDYAFNRTLTTAFSGTDYGVTAVRYNRELFDKAGDFFVVEGNKGAACILDMYQENGRCSLHFDPVITFDQAAFDAAMGERTFNLSDYFALSFSGAAVPEPATWAMMILGMGAIGGALRRRRSSTTIRYV